MAPAHPKPQWSHWNNMVEVRLWQAVLLSLNIEPGADNYQTYHTWQSRSVFNRRLQQRLQQSIAGVLKGTLPSRPSLEGTLYCDEKDDARRERATLLRVIHTLMELLKAGGEGDRLPKGKEAGIIEAKLLERFNGPKAKTILKVVRAARTEEPDSPLSQRGKSAR